MSDLKRKPLWKVILLNVINTLLSGWMKFLIAFAFFWLGAFVVASFIIAQRRPPSTPPQSPAPALQPAVELQSFIAHINLVRAPCDDLATVARRLQSVSAPSLENSPALLQANEAAEGACEVASHDITMTSIPQTTQETQRDAIRSARSDLSDAYWSKGVAFSTYSADDLDSSNPGPVTHDLEAKAMNQRIDTAMLALKQAAGL